MKKQKTNQQQKIEYTTTFSLYVPGTYITTIGCRMQMQQIGNTANRTLISFLFSSVGRGELDKKKNHEIITALHYKPLYYINRSEKSGKKYTSHGL